MHLDFLFKNNISPDRNGDEIADSDKADINDRECADRVATDIVDSEADSEDKTVDHEEHRRYEKT